MAASPSGRVGQFLLPCWVLPYWAFKPPSASTPAFQGRGIYLFSTVV
jgi:hypothetical protein